MLKTTLVTAAILAAVAAPALASDDGRRDHEERSGSSSDGRACPVRPAAERLSIDQVVLKLKEQGYAVHKVETSHGCYEVKATDAKGARVDMYLDPATAEIIRGGDRS
ncbi:MAG: PepSY domain-containing protein [Hyphomicrobiaceae bacterium]